MSIKDILRNDDYNISLNITNAGTKYFYMHAGFSGYGPSYFKRVNFSVIICGVDTK